MAPAACHGLGGSVVSDGYPGVRGSKIAGRRWAPLATGRILWVGGREADHRTLEAAAKNAGLADVSFALPPEALQMIKNRAIDVLLVDVNQSSVDVLNLISAAGSGERIP